MDCQEIQCLCGCGHRTKAWKVIPPKSEMYYDVEEHELVVKQAGKRDGRVSASLSKQLRNMVLQDWEAPVQWEKYQDVCSLQSLDDDLEPQPPIDRILSISAFPAIAFTNIKKQIRVLIQLPWPEPNCLFNLPPADIIYGLYVSSFRNRPGFEVNALQVEFGENHRVCAIYEPTEANPGYIKLDPPFYMLNSCFFNFSFRLCGSENCSALQDSGLLLMVDCGFVENDTRCKMAKRVKDLM